MQKQEIQYGPKAINYFGKQAAIVATVRHDDRCKNGRNTFAITGEIRIRRRKDCEICGMIHGDIAKHFPELAPLLKWHLCNTDGPMNYVANSLYWAGKTKWEKPNLEHFRSCAIWPDATEQDMLAATEESLNARLPALMAGFRAAVESLGLTY